MSHNLDAVIAGKARPYKREAAKAILLRLPVEAGYARDIE